MSRLLALLVILVAALIDYLRRPRPTSQATGPDQAKGERPVA